MATSTMPRLCLRPKEAVMRGMIWAFVGATFGALYVPLFEFLRQVLPVSPSYVLACAAAAAAGALFYGSMRLAVIVAVFANVAIFVYFVFFAGGGLPPTYALAVGAAVGLVVGALYGASVRDSRVFRAHAKLLAGTVAGIGGATLAVLAVALFGEVRLAWLVGVLAPVCGLFYVLVAPRFVERFSHLLPPAVDGALVGAAVGAFLGLAFWVLAGVVLDEVTAPWDTMTAHIAAQWPGAIIFAALGACMLGLARSVCGLEWLDL